jgi:acyl-CoA thioester hydrolase
MDEFSRIVQIRWSDLDPNFHIRHSVYYDWGAFCRIEFLNEQGLTAEVMQQHHIGPVLFREESLFRREIKMGDEIKINLRLIKAKNDYSRWSIQHQLTKAENILCAVLTVEGAWIDVLRRKLSSPPGIVYQVFDQMPKADTFEWMVK